MLTRSQLSYMQEVLGALPTRLFRSIKKPSRVVVVCPALDSEQRALLDRILATTELTDFAMSESVVQADHILDFRPGQKFGRQVGSQSIQWCFHPVAELMGNTPDVTIRKREVWNLLQGFIKEFAEP
jgi:hypothetical protein